MKKNEVELKKSDNRSPTEVKRGIAKNNGETIQCEICEEHFLEDELHPLYTVSGEKEYDHICDDCECNMLSGDEPVATVFFDDDDEPCYISTYSDDTGGDFKAKWHSTDAWRGYYDIISDKWTLVHDDCILSYSEDAEQLKEFDDAFRKALKNMGIGYARVFSRTSNLFSSGFDFFVEKGKEVEANAVRLVLVLKYRNNERFISTALTGADAKDLTENDKLFVKVAKKLKNGMSQEEIINLVEEELK